MCGIIACVGSTNAVDTVLTGLQNLEYRGYDSAGLAIQNDTDLVVRKRAGKISDLTGGFVRELPDGVSGIGHTRWSTHGPPTDANAHPHTSASGTVAVVHNGIISNYEALRAELEGLGYAFRSDTDTEVIPHLVEHYLDDGYDSDQAFRKTIERLEGSYAIALMIEGEDTVRAARQGSPLVVGLHDDAYYLASDVPAFLEFTDEVIYLEDGDVVTVGEGSLSITDLDGTPLSREIDTVDWDPEETGKGGYDHYMHKEIESQPESLSNTIRGRIDPETPAVRLDGFPAGCFEGVSEVHFVACGTSYHAALYGARLLEEANVRVRTSRASEFTGRVPDPEGTLVVAVTQSGETADTLGALRTASEAGARTLALTNVVGSTVAREADEVLYIRAGPEIGVAATKTFSSQVVTLALLVERLREDIEGATEREDSEAFLEALSVLPNQIEEVIRTSRAEALSAKYNDRGAYFFIGHALQHPVALEGALKFKEITYEHAEGFAAGELKHGPLALVTPGTPIFALFDGKHDEKTHTNAKEAQARGAEIIAITARERTAGFADDVLVIPDTHPDLSGLLANVQLQFVSYYTARLLDRPIDKPRNLAKSVTVE
ncbi:glutamine--fructose-6-phosphate transaminase (isomerizing) [Halalkalicoccus jeotgali]|uniref:Glutamine--fructose-6-phosphate aminotransferase [isomerizing] n=1 Tax=Halalkalicoccus jeotgali (strain DSM 18796 / CECT 7217 / JCM 14584 / KCTC 4019 / B3) TaxID=795797 RepID=D8J5S5_HALJB|nr:glutamine--fructose-6-phosphate transaminase (isomerizing) [Halalkalicoccus jeotgali]ADJ13731.1 glucosamine/fructose-6-phosphate aminotransferase, isomerizing [Halalkalicoccus jeotgali B3]ELY34223.1 glucosamine/fructose-6-phosphate aminotransferase [Halalkalicoccus jeotgali B3]